MSDKLADLDSRMDGALNALHKDFTGLRTGRASVDFLAPVVVDAYGSKVPLNQVANVNTPDARTISVQVWDKSTVAAVEKGIREADLGVNPSVDGMTVRVTMPELNEERRKELIKLARKYAENARVSIRNVRRDGMDEVKKLQKDGEFSEDDARRHSDEIQKLTDEMVAKVDASLSAKEEDILKV